MTDSPIRLLFIDDDAALCALVRRDLQRHGFAVTTAADGAAGLARLDAVEFDVIALDHNLPGRSGLEVLVTIAARPDAPPVLYVTGEAEGRIAVAALKAGAVDYVIKDASGEFLPLLRAAIDAALEARELRRARERAERDLRASRDKFEALAAERQTLIDEINHRVGNSLQIVSALLRLQRSAIDSPDAQAALGNAIARVDAIGHVHRQLYAADSVHAVDLKRYLDHLVADLRRAVAGDGATVALTVDAEPVTTSADRVVSIGILVTELLINAIKHAFPADGAGAIRVACRRDGPDAFLVVVEDDGRGMPGAETAAKGLGSRIIAMMVSKLQATMEVDPAWHGTRVVVRVPGQPPAS